MRQVEIGRPPGNLWGVPELNTFQPNFFIVGAPRCGTTSLSKYLKWHPQVRLSDPKETHFFTSIYPAHPELDVQRDYVGRFYRPPKPGQRAAGEASVEYLYSPETLAKLVQLWPDAKFIVMARNPMDQLPSYHARLLYMLVEDVEDFDTAWALQESRQQGLNLPRFCDDARTLQYREVGSIGAHTERLIALAGAPSTLVLLYDDLVSDPHGLYKRTLEFLGLEDDGRVDFPRIWKGQRYRSRRLQELIYQTPQKIGGVKPYLWKRSGQRKRPKTRAQRLYKRLLRLNISSAKPPAIEPKLRQRLREVFAPDIEKLGRIVGRDLSHWA